MAIIIHQNNRNIIINISYFLFILIIILLHIFNIRKFQKFLKQKLWIF